MIELTTTTDGDTTIVRSVGRLTMATAADLTDVINAAVAGGAPKVVIDLTETAFVDSSGLGALVSGLRRTRQGNGDLRIVAPSEQVAAVLELTNLDRVLYPYASVTAARDGW